MSGALIDQLVEKSDALIAAFDARDIEAIETALPAFASAAEALKTPGVWQQTPGLLEKVQQALARTDVARTRVLCLADHTRRRMDLLATAAGRFDAMPALYGRNGR